MNLHINHEPILQSLHLPVKPLLPFTTRCPFCQLEQLDIYLTANGGRWYICQYCGFKGDSIELYAKAHNIDNIHDAVAELAANKILPMTKNEIRFDAVAGYINTYIEHRKKMTAMFEKACKNIREARGPYVVLLRELQLWDGIKATNGPSVIGRFVGAMHKKELIEFGIPAPRASFTFNIIFPYYDVPGRLCSILLFSKKARTKRIYVGPPGNNTEEDGLLMMDTLRPSNDVIVAMRDPVIALQLQRKRLNMSTEPIALVAYEDRTHNAWQAVKARRILFWEQEKTSTLLKQSSKHNNAFIANRPRFDPRFTDQRIVTYSLAQFLSVANNSALPWPSAVKKFLLDAHHWDAVSTLGDLELTQDQLKLIYEACTPSECKKIKRLMGESSYDKYVIVSNMRFAEIDDAWWLVHKGGNELASDAILRIERAVHVVETDENQYEGVIIFKGHQVPFRAACTEVDRRGASWIQDTLMRAGVGVPTITKRTQYYISLLAKKFHEVQYVKRVARLGWYPDDKVFVFPNFSIIDGQIDETARAAVSTAGSTPAVNVKAWSPKHGDWDIILENTPEWAVLWAGLSCFMTNILAPIIGSKTKPVGFVGGIGSMANVIGAHLLKETGMLVAPIKLQKEPVAEATHLARCYNYPVWLDLYEKDRRAVPRLSPELDIGLMTVLLDGEATALGVGNSWIFIKADKIMAQRDKLPDLTGFMHYLAWLQAKQFELPIATSIWHSVLQSMQDWATETLGASQLQVFDQAAKLLHTPDDTGLDRRFLQLVFWLQHAQKIVTAQQEFYEAYKQGILPTNRAHVIVDATANKVYINTAAMRKAVTAASLPMPRMDEAVVALSQNVAISGFQPLPSGFIITNNYWMAERNKWQQTRL